MPPTRKVAKPRNKRPRKPLVAKPVPETVVSETVPEATKDAGASSSEEMPITPKVAQPEVMGEKIDQPKAKPSPTEVKASPRENQAESRRTQDPLPPPPGGDSAVAQSEPRRETSVTLTQEAEVNVVQEPPRQERRDDRRGERREGREGRRGECRENLGREGRRSEQQRQERREEPRREPQEMGPQTRGLTLLGTKTTVYSDRYTPAVLEAFENRHPENDYFVKFNCPEFTSLCPITGQPDFATLYISYIPDRKMVESKSLKLYLFGFRNHGAFHEDCVNIIMKDLIKLMAPRYIEVWGRFLPRGGLSIDPYANYGRPTTRWEEFARQRLLMHDLSPERVDNR